MAERGFYSIGQVVVEVDKSAISRARGELRNVKDGISRAMTTAMLRTLSRGKTRVVEQLAAVLTCKPAVIRRNQNGKDRILTSLSSLKMTSEMIGSIDILGRKIGAINFELVPDAKGYSVKYYRDGSTAGVGGRGASPRGQFIGRGLRGNKQLWSRSPWGTKHRQETAHYQPNIGKMRESIERMRGLSLFEVYRGLPGLTVDLSKFLADEFTKNLDSQCDRFLGRAKAARPAA